MAIRVLVILFLLVAVVNLVRYSRLKLQTSNGEHRADPPLAGMVPANSIFHRPTGADCPIGTRLLKGYFKESDGTLIDACHNPNGDGSIDYLNPGESAHLFFSTSSKAEEE